MEKRPPLSFVSFVRHNQAATRVILQDFSHNGGFRLIVAFRDSRSMNTRVTAVSYSPKRLHYADRLAVAQAAIAQRRRRSNHDTSNRDQSRVSLIRVFDT